METNTIEEHCKNISKWKVVLHIFVGFFMMLLGDLINGLCWDVIFSSVLMFPLPKWGYIAIRSVGCIVITYGLLYLYIKKVLKVSMIDFRIGQFHIKPVYIACAFILPALVTLCLFATGGTFINNQHGRKGIVGITMVGLFYALKAGIVEEMIFRGYIMKFIEAKWNKTGAVLIPAVIFGILHIAIWASALIHVLWNTAMIGKVLDISTIYDTNSAFSFVLTSRNSLLTGGNFGIEASVFSIIGYMAVILLSWYLLKNKALKNY